MPCCPVQPIQDVAREGKEFVTCDSRVTLTPGAHSASCKAQRVTIGKNDERVLRQLSDCSVQLGYLDRLQEPRVYTRNYVVRDATKTEGFLSSNQVSRWSKVLVQNHVGVGLQQDAVPSIMVQEEAEQRVAADCEQTP